MRAMQDPLPLQLPLQLTHGGWVNHGGVAEACATMALWGVQGGGVWLRSDGVAGKSHLLHALAMEQADCGLITVSSDEGSSSQVQSANWLARLEGCRWWMVDVSAGALADPSQLALFHLIERARAQAFSLAVAWRCEDAMIVRPELLSRLRTLTQVMLLPPQEDAALLAVVDAELVRMQWKLHPGVQRYLLTHTSRQLGRLLQTLYRLQEQSLARKMRPSLSNVQQLLQAAGGNDSA
ncbi:MAG: hypothetical protein R8J84_09195 [Mariprofundales bacterium]